MTREELVAKGEAILAQVAKVEIGIAEQIKLLNVLKRQASLMKLGIDPEEIATLRHRHRAPLKGYNVVCYEVVMCDGTVHPHVPARLVDPYGEHLRSTP